MRSDRGSEYGCSNVGVGTTAPTTKLHVTVAPAALRLEHNILTGRYLDVAYDASTSSPYVDFTTGGVSSRYLDFRYGGSSKMVLNGDGNIGIGSTSPRAGLEVANGSLLLKNSVNNGTATTIDFALGNIQYTTGSCGALTLNNMADGGIYIVVVKGATSATCSFTTPGLTAHMPVDNGATIANKHTMYNFIVVGTDVYIS